MKEERLETFVGHLIEFRKRLIYIIMGFFLASIVAFFFFDDILSLVLKPFSGVPNALASNILYASSILDGFILKMKLSFLSGLIFSTPYTVYHIARFVFPGLKPKEKKIILFFLIASALIILTATYLLYFKIIPFSISFLTQEDFFPKSVGLLLNYQENVGYLIQFFFLSLIVFQLPLFLEILLMLNVVTLKGVLKYIRHIIVVIFIIAGIVTPPDVFSLLMVAIPLIFFFGLSLLVAKIFGFGKGDV